jgi:hypothetical protein
MALCCCSSRAITSLNPPPVSLLRVAVLDSDLETVGRGVLPRLFCQEAY